MSPKLPLLVFCGPQTTPSLADILETIRLYLLHDPDLTPLTKAVVDLVDHWPQEEDGSTPFNSRVKDSLRRLRCWVTDSEFCFPGWQDAPNALLAPLTVILHIAQYVLYIRSLGIQDGHRQVLQSVSRGGVQGLCVGFLTAVSLACSESLQVLYQNGATAIRLAVLAGAAVDSDRFDKSASNEVACLLATWSPDVREQDVIEVIEKYPQVTHRHRRLLRGFIR
jgi:hypothetical protein